MTCYSIVYIRSVAIKKVGNEILDNQCDAGYDKFRGQTDVRLSRLVYLAVLGPKLKLWKLRTDLKRTKN